MNKFPYWCYASASHYIEQVKWLKETFGDPDDIEDCTWTYSVVRFRFSTEEQLTWFTMKWKDK